MTYRKILKIKGPKICIPKPKNLKNNELVEVTIQKVYADKEIMEHFNIYEDHITIRDNRIGRYIDIYPKDNELWCEFCQAKNCEHIRFALTVPEVEKVLEKRGWI